MNCSLSSFRQQPFHTQGSAQVQAGRWKGAAQKQRRGTRGTAMHPRGRLHRVWVKNAGCCSSATLLSGSPSQLPGPRLSHPLQPQDRVCSLGPSPGSPASFSSPLLAAAWPSPAWGAAVDGAVPVIQGELSLLQHQRRTWNCVLDPNIQVQGLVQYRSALQLDQRPRLLAPSSSDFPASFPDVPAFIAAPPVLTGVGSWMVSSISWKEASLSLVHPSPQHLGQLCGSHFLFLSIVPSCFHGNLCSKSLILCFWSALNVLAGLEFLNFLNSFLSYLHRASLVAQTLKRLPTMRETQVRFLDGEDSLEKEMATQSSTLAWEIPWMEEPLRLQSMGSQRVGHDWVTSVSVYIHLLQVQLLLQLPLLRLQELHLYLLVHHTPRQQERRSSPLKHWWSHRLLPGSPLAASLCLHPGPAYTICCAPAALSSPGPPWPPALEAVEYVSRAPSCGKTQDAVPRHWCWMFIPAPI